MKYRILKSGHIEIVDEGKGLVIHANQPIPEKYKEQIETDPNFAKYRTQENADAYERSLIPEPKTKAKLQSEMKAEAERIAMKELIDERIKADPYLSAMENVKAKIDSGEINENARKAIKDEIEAQRTI